MNNRYPHKHHLAAVERRSQPWKRKCHWFTSSFIGGTGPGGWYDGASSVRSQQGDRSADYYKEEVCHLDGKRWRYTWLFNDEETLVDICENTFYNDLPGGCAP